MSSKSARTTEKTLKAVLARFDAPDKESVARRLVRELKLEEDGEPYPEQVAALLHRDLTPEEEFRLSVLDAALNAGGGGAAEEEEEEE
jgi:hypothetical protein